MMQSLTQKPATKYPLKPAPLSAIDKYMRKNELTRYRPERNPCLLYVVTTLMLMFIVHLLIWA